LLLPKVSVIVPNYNHASFLRRRLDSIYSQTYKNFEVILLDDASQDGSREILRAYAEKYSNISKAIFNQENSGGVFRQWSKGIAAATGDLIWIAESDDYCDSDFLEKLVGCFDDEAVMLAYAQTIFVNPDETLMPNEFEVYVRDLACKSKWSSSYTNTAHQEVSEALGIMNTIPNASAAIFRRPVDMTLLNDETWLSMRVAGDWIFYLHQLRGGKISYTTETASYFRRYKGSAAESFYQKQDFFRELAVAAKHVQNLYAVPQTVLNQSLATFRQYYDRHVGISDAQFHEWIDVESILNAQSTRSPNIVVSTQGFYPGGAEILPIRMANELKRQGHSVILLSGGHGKREYGVRHMLRRDVPVVETPDINETKQIIKDFGLEVLNSHQWHVQKYPCVVSDVFHGLRAHIASLHGMIEHGDAFGVTAMHLKTADKHVSTWVYTADKNITPFIDNCLYQADSQRFVKLPNGMQPPLVSPINRSELGIPEDAFVFCCVSRAIPEKGWLEAIEALTLAREISGLDIRLILVGNGPVYDEFLRLGVPSFVFLAGFNENSVGLYAASQAGIMLTKFKSESFPLTIVDCLFAERPYIATSVGEIRNMLTTDTGLAGEVVELENWEVPVEKVADAVVSLASNTTVYQAAKERAREAAKRYRIDLVAKQYLELFDRDIQRSVSLGG
jgi:glycosyltransferase involved in cell wall biosynthesis